MVFNTTVKFRKVVILIIKKAFAFAKKHPVYIATIHAIGGIGIGILIASPLAGEHPVRWGIAFIIASLLGHLYILFS